MKVLALIKTICLAKKAQECFYGRPDPIRGRFRKAQVRNEGRAHTSAYMLSLHVRSMYDGALATCALVRFMSGFRAALKRKDWFGQRVSFPDT